MELHEAVVAYFPTTVLIFAFPSLKTSLLQARKEAINPFLLSGSFMLPEVLHGEQQKQRKNSYYFNSLIQADLREYLEAL